MQIHFDLRADGGTLTVTRDLEDPKFRGMKEGRGERQLLGYLASKLNGRGFNLIRKEMAKDGHLTSEDRFYLRPRSRKAERQNTPHVYILNPNWDIAGAEEAWNREGTVVLQVLGDPNEEQPDWADRIRKLFPHWVPANDGTGSRMYFLCNLTDGYYRGKTSQIVRFASYRTAQRRADILNFAPLPPPDRPK